MTNRTFIILIYLYCNRCVCKIPPIWMSSGVLWYAHMANQMSHIKG